MLRANQSKILLLSALIIFSQNSFAENRKIAGQTYYKTNSTVARQTMPYKPAAGYKGEKPLPPKLPPAAPVAPTLILRDGPYVGIAGGYDSYKVHENIPFNGSSTTSTYSTSLNGTGIIGEILGGYGHYFNEVLYLGGEAFLNISSVYQNSNIAITDTTDTMSYNSKFIVTTGYGFGLLPGVKLNDAGLLFFRLGYHVARLRGQENRIINSTTIVNSTSSWSGGFGYGLGFEEAMVENLSLRGEYIHVDYRTFNASTSSNTEFSPSDNQFMLSLIYHFL